MPPSKVKVINPTPPISSETKVNHPFIKYRNTAGQSFTVVCQLDGWESPTCYDRQDEVNAIKRHWLAMEIQHLERIKAEKEAVLAAKREDYHANGRNARRRANKKARRQEDGATQGSERKGPAKAQAGVGEAVRGGQTVGEAVRSPKSGRRGSGGWT